MRSRYNRFQKKTRSHRKVFNQASQGFSFFNFKWVSFFLLFLSSFRVSAQSVNPTKTLFPSLWLESDALNQFSMPLAPLVSDPNATFSQIQNSDGSPSLLQLNLYRYSLSNQLSLGAQYLTIKNNLAYFCYLGALTIANVTDVSSASLLSTTAVTTGGCYKPFVSNSRCYFFSGNKVFLFDVTQPSHPVLKSTVSFTGPPRAADTSNHFTAIVGQFGLSIFNNTGDVLNIISNINVGNSWDVRWVNHWGIVATNGYTKIVNLTDVNNPSSVNAVAPPSSYAFKLDLYGNILGIADYTSAGYELYDISNLPSLNLLSSQAGYNYGSVLGIALSANQLFLAGQFGLDVYNISTPTATNFLAHYPTLTTKLWDVALQGNNIVVTDDALLVNVIDPSTFSFSVTPHVAMKGLYFLHLIVNANNTQIPVSFEVSVQSPVLFRQYQASNPFSVLAGNQTFSVNFYPKNLFTNTASCLFLDFKYMGLNPDVRGLPNFVYLSPPVFDYQYQNPSISGDPFAVMLLNNMNSIGAVLYQYGVEVVDFSSSTPQSLGSCIITGPAGITFVQNNNYLFIQTTQYHMEIVMINNNIPQAIAPFPSSFDLTYQSTDLVWDRNCVWIIGSFPYLEIANVTTPASPSLVLQFPISPASTNGNARIFIKYQQISVQALIIGSSGLQVLDITNIASPTALSGLNWNINFQDAALLGEQIFFSAGTSMYQLNLNDFSIQSNSLGLALEYFTVNGLTAAGGSAGKLVFVDLTGLSVSQVMFPGVVTVIRPFFSGNQILLPMAGDGVGGLNCNNFYYTMHGVATPNNAGNYLFQIQAFNEWTIYNNASDPTQQSNYTLVIQGGPKVNTPIPTQNAFISESFSFSVLQGVFSHPNSYVLSYSFSNYPQWLSPTAGGGLFGIPGALNLGFYSLTVTANDGYGGSAKITFNVRVTYPPILQQPLQNVLCNVQTNCLYSVRPGSITVPDNTPFSVMGTLNNGSALPSYIVFHPSNMSFEFLFPNDAFLGIAIQAQTIYGGNLAAYFNVEAESFPKFQASFSNQLIPIGLPYSFLISPSTCNTIEANRILSYEVNNLPTDLAFNPSVGQIYGTPSSVLANVTASIQVNCVDDLGGKDTRSFKMIFAYVPTLNPNYAWNRFVLNIKTPWSLSFPNDLFLNQEGGILSLVVSWPNSFNISYVNQTLSAWFNQSAVVPVSILATNYKSASTNLVITLVGTPFAQLNFQAPFIVFPINQVLSYTLSNFIQGGTPPYSLTAGVVLTSSRKRHLLSNVTLSSLPPFIQFDPNQVRFSSNNPTVLDRANMTIRVLVTDAIGAMVFKDIRCLVDYIPEVISGISPVVSGTVGVFLQYNLSSVFQDHSGRSLNYSWNIIYPNGLTLNGSLLSGVPQLEGTSPFTVNAVSAIGSTTQNMALSIGLALPPKFLEGIGDQQATVLTDSSFACPNPTDPQGLNISLTATCDSQPCPEWFILQKNPCQIQIKRPPRSATNNNGPRIYNVALMANNGLASSSLEFKLMMGGHSQLAHDLAILKIVGPVLSSCITLLLFGWGFRATIYGFFKKNRQILEVRPGEKIKKIIGDRRSTAYVVSTKLKFGLITLSQYNDISNFFNGKLTATYVARDPNNPNAESDYILSGTLDDHQKNETRKIEVYDWLGLIRLELTLVCDDKNEKNLQIGNFPEHATGELKGEAGQEESTQGVKSMWSQVGFFIEPAANSNKAAEKNIVQPYADSDSGDILENDHEYDIPPVQAINLIDSDSESDPMPLEVSDRDKDEDQLIQEEEKEEKEENDEADAATTSTHSTNYKF